MSSPEKDALPWPAWEPELAVWWAGNHYIWHSLGSEIDLSICGDILYIIYMHEELCCAIFCSCRYIQQQYRYALSPDTMESENKQTNIAIFCPFHASTITIVYIQPFTLKCYLDIYKDYDVYIYIYWEVRLFSPISSEQDPKFPLCIKKLLASEPFSWTPTCAVPARGLTQLV